MSWVESATVNGRTAAERVQKTYAPAGAVTVSCALPSFVPSSDERAVTVTAPGATPVTVAAPLPDVATVARVGSEELHVTSVDAPFCAFTWAARARVRPTSTAPVAGATVTPTTRGVGRWLVVVGGSPGPSVRPAGPSEPPQPAAR